MVSRVSEITSQAKSSQVACKEVRGAGVEAALLHALTAALLPASPHFTSCAAPPAPYAQPPRWRARPHHIYISLARHTVRSPTTRAVAHRYHGDAVNADHAAYPTVPQAHRPNAHPPVAGVKLAG